MLHIFAQYLNTFYRRLLAIVWNEGNDCVCCASFVMMMLHRDTCSFKGKIKKGGLVEASIIQIKNGLVEHMLNDYWVRLKIVIIIS